MIWAVAKEGDDPGNEMYLWRGAAALPVAYGLLSDAELVGHLSLKQAQI